LRKRIEARTPEIIDRLVQAALSGDVQAASVLIGRVLPPIKATEPPIPGLTIASLDAAPEAVLAALGRGALTTDQVTAISQLVTALARAKETVELESRISALEARHAEQP
jgi:hypothetical protein